MRIFVYIIKDVFVYSYYYIYNTSFYIYKAIKVMEFNELINLYSYILISWHIFRLLGKHTSQG